jgi:RNA polymerase sigma-70 factor (ECF subfamily)
MDDLTRLWLDARDGDRASLHEAIRASQGDVYRLALHLVGTVDADDVTQDTFVRAWRALPAFRGDSSARTWLLVIARRACADAIRRSTRQRRLWSRARSDPASASATDSEPDATRAFSLEALIDGLHDDQRVAFVLTQVIGCPYAEAATICSVPIGTIRSRVARARERLVTQVDAAEAG